MAVSRQAAAHTGHQHSDLPLTGHGESLRRPHRVSVLSIVVVVFVCVSVAGQAARQEGKMIIKKVCV